MRRLGARQRPRKLAALVKQRRCTPFTRLTTLSRGTAAGINTILFSGKVNGRALKPGRYRAVLTVADAAGNVSRRQVTAFQVLASKKTKKRARR